MDQPSYVGDEERKNDFLKVIEGMAELPEPFTIVNNPPRHPPPQLVHVCRL